MTYARQPLSLLRCLVLALIVALALERWLTIEWTWPTCNNGDNWAAAYGFPFPYTQWSLVSSMEYAWVPEMFVLNIALLAIGVYALLGLLPAFRHSTKIYPALIVLATLGALINLLGLWVTMVAAVPSLAHTEGGESMWDLRPVAFHINGTRRYECTPSPWWFPDAPQQAQSRVVQEPVAGLR